MNHPTRIEEQQRLADRMLNAAKQAGADAADLVIFDSVDVSVACRLGKQEELERSESVSTGLRVWVGEKQAIASSTDMSDATIAELAERAVAMAKVATPDEFSTLADASLLASEWPELDLYDGQEPSVETLYEMAQTAEQTARDVKGITNSEGADAYYGTHAVTLATSHGFVGSYLTSNASISVSVLAGTGSDMQTDYDYDTCRHVVDLSDPAVLGKSAAERALKRLHPKKIGSEALPLVFEPRVGRSLIGSFAGAISGAAVARGTTFLKDALGEPLFAPTVDIIDDPFIVRGRASHPFDGEGVRSSKQTMVDGGVLKSWFLDTRSAAKLGMKTTGHASRGLASAPSPSSSNLYMQAGSVSPETLIGDIKRGVYITETFGMGVNNVTGDYSQGAGGFMIENGELTYPVAEITIAGHMREMFKQLTPANDLEFRYGTNVPTYRIDGMTVAGN